MGMPNFITTCDILYWDKSLDKIETSEANICQIAQVYQYEEGYGNIYSVEVWDKCKLCSRKLQTSCNYDIFVKNI